MSVLSLWCAQLWLGGLGEQLGPGRASGPQFWDFLVSLREGRASPILFGQLCIHTRHTSPFPSSLGCLVLRKTLSSLIFPQGGETWASEPAAPNRKNIALAWNDNLASRVSLGVSYKVLFQTCDCLLRDSVLSISNVASDPLCYHTSS